ILGQNELLSGTHAALRVAVFNHDTGEELKGVPVAVRLINNETGDSESLGDLVSGEATPKLLELPDWKQGEYTLSVRAEPNGDEEGLKQPIVLTRSWKLMLSSDKPIYQPGQTIHLRSLALRKPDLKPVSGEEVTFTITDPKGNMIFKHRATGSK